MKRAALILAALAAIMTAAAAPVRTATESFVTNKIAEAVAATTNAVASAIESATNGLATAADVAAKADKTDLEGFATEADLLSFYYPDGNVTSMSQITTNGIEYAVGSDGGAYVVKGDGLSGHVVLPWKVTIEGNEYKVTAVNGNAFDGTLFNNSVTEVDAPTTVKSVGDYAFNSCDSLTTVNLPSVTSIGDGAFLYCTNLATINLPSATSIGERAFGNRNSLTTVNLPSAISIGHGSFSDCDSLTTVNLPSATIVEVNAFSGCTSLTTVDLPSATRIGEAAFSGCGSLASVNLPSVTSIAGMAFVDCGSLTTVDFGSSPKSAVPSVSDFAFEGVPTSCKFIIPLGMYDEWIAASGWSDLYSAGYKFEGYASTAQLANKADKATTLAGYGVAEDASNVVYGIVTNVVAASNPTFSNAVLAVGLNIDTNSVAVLNEIASTFGGFPIEGTATTVGGLLAALAAAVAWLRKKKIDKLTVTGMSNEVTANGGVAKLDDFFIESNSLLTGTIDARLPYPLYAVADETGLLKDRAINTTSLASVTVPDNFTDLLVRASVASSLSVTMPESIATKYGDTFPGEAGEYLITITKTGTSEAYVRTIKLEVANA